MKQSKFPKQMPRWIIRRCNRDSSRQRTGVHEIFAYQRLDPGLISYHLTKSFIERGWLEIIYEPNWKVGTV